MSVYHYTTKSGIDKVDFDPDVFPFTEATIVMVTPLLALGNAENVTENDERRRLRITTLVLEIRSTLPMLPNTRISTPSLLPWFSTVNMIYVDFPCGIVKSFFAYKSLTSKVSDLMALWQIRSKEFPFLVCPFSLILKNWPGGVKVNECRTPALSLDFRETSVVVLTSSPSNVMSSACRELWSILSTPPRVKIA